MSRMNGRQIPFGKICSTMSQAEHFPNQVSRTMRVPKRGQNMLKGPSYALNLCLFFMSYATPVPTVNIHSAATILQQHGRRSIPIESRVQFIAHACCNYGIHSCRPKLNRCHVSAIITMQETVCTIQNQKDIARLSCWFIYCSKPFLFSCRCI